MRKLLVDVDDTVLNFADTFETWARKEGHEFDGRLKELSGGGIPVLLGITREETDVLVTRFTLESDEFADLPPEPCAEVILPQFHKAGYQLIAITATIPTEFNRKRRAANLKRAFGFDFHTVTLSGLGESKVPHLQEYEPTFWVEDNFSHAVAGSEVGHETFLLHRSYNAGNDHADVTRVTDWHEIAEKLL